MFFLINFKPWFAQYIFSVTFPCVILLFFPTPPITFLIVRSSHVLLNRRPTAPVYRLYVKSTAPRGLHAIKSALNPGFGRVKPPLCPGAWGFNWLIHNYNFHKGDHIKYERKVESGECCARKFISALYLYSGHLPTLLPTVFGPLARALPQAYQYQVASPSADNPRKYVRWDFAGRNW